MLFILGDMCWVTLVLGGMHWRELCLLQSHQGSCGSRSCASEAEEHSLKHWEEDLERQTGLGSSSSSSMSCTWPWACPPFPLNLSSPIQWDQSHLLRLMWKFRRWYLETGKALSSMPGRRQALSQRKYPFCCSNFLWAHLHTHSINTTTRQWDNPEFYLKKKSITLGVFIFF